MMMKKILLLLVVSFLFPGCSTTQRYCVETPYTIKSQIKSCEVMVAYSEKNIKAETPQTHPVSAGLIIGLIGEISRSAERSQIEKFLPLIHQEVKEMALGNLLKEEVSHALHKTKWLGVQKIYLIEGAQRSTVEEMRAKSQSDVFVLVELKGAMNSQFETLTGELALEMYPVSEKLCGCIKVSDPKTTPIYRKTFVFAESLPVPEGEREENAKQWVRNNGETIKKSLQNIVKNLTAKWQTDLNKEE